MNSAKRMKPTSAIICCPALAVAAFVVATAAANPAPNQNSPDNDPVPLIAVPLILINDVPLVDAIRNLARQAGGNYIIDPRGSGALGTNVTIRFENVSAREALGALLKNHQLTMVANPATTVARIAPAGLGVKPVPASKVGTNTSAVFPLVVMDCVPLTEAVTKLAGAAQLTVSLDPNWAESSNKARLTVSFRWEKITARQALAALLDNYELVLIEEPGDVSARITVKLSGGASVPRKNDPERKQP